MTDAVHPNLRSARRAARDLLETIAVYLIVAAIAGASYALCATAWNGGTFVRLWLASVAPIGIYLVARSIWVVYRRRSAHPSGSR